MEKGLLINAEKLKGKMVIFLMHKDIVFKDYISNICH